MNLVCDEESIVVPPIHAIYVCLEIVYHERVQGEQLHHQYFDQIIKFALTYQADLFLSRDEFGNYINQFD
jgi:hypothetical protein